MLERWIIRHWIALTAGGVATGIVLHITYAIRGQLVIGGELYIKFLLFVCLAPQISILFEFFF